jgi:acyl-CoA dehydrogenase
MLLNPHTYEPGHFDDQTRELLRTTIEWFEGRGKARLLADYHAHVSNGDYLDFISDGRLAASFLTPSREAGGLPGCRWDMARIAALTEITGFYGMNYLEPWQVTLLGLCAAYQSENPEARARVRSAVEAGGLGAFAVTERAHGADLYATEMQLSPDNSRPGRYLANGEKYYIGLGDRATTVAVFGRLADSDTYVFFRADATHPSFQALRNVVAQQSYVAHLRLVDYPVEAADILHLGEDAFSAVLNTVSVGKLNLCFGGIGAATHAFFEGLTHAHRRVLYGKPVTSMTHVRRMLVDAHARLTGMRMFCYRALDYTRSASPEDRRYLLFNSVAKARATEEATRVVSLLTDVVAAKAYESDAYLTVARQDTSGLAHLEGTAAVNLGLIAKFAPAYLFAPAELPEVPQRLDAADDEFLFHQGPARGMSRVRFQDWRTVYARHGRVPNVAQFATQAEALTDLMATAGPDADQMQDLDLMLIFGQLFSLVVYGQLVLEQAVLTGHHDDSIDTIFDVLVRDFSSNAVQLHGARGATEAQRSWALSAVRAPAVDHERFARAWKEVEELAGAYEMRP